MQVKSRWIDEIVTETASATVKLPFERGARRAALRARLLRKPTDSRAALRA